METSENIYNRIQWDGQLDPNRFAVGCRDRFKKIKEVPFLQFDTSRMPWNRVWYFKMDGEMVWNRETKLDRFGDGTIKSLLPDKKETAVDSTFGHLPSYRFSPEAGRWEEGATPPGEVGYSLPEELSVVTWNVLFDQEKQATYVDDRLPWLWDDLEASEAHIIALQEMTPNILGHLLSRPWVRENYLVSDISGETVQPYGQVLLSRLPLRQLSWYHFSSQKKVLRAEVELGRETLALGVVHLTSQRAKDAEMKRARQIEEIISHFIPSDETTFGASLVLGDFNFFYPGEGTTLGDQGFRDAWKNLHPGDRGFTFDPTRNTLATYTSQSGQPARYDRIYYQSGRLTAIPRRIWRRGTLAHYGAEGGRFPSDHYGLHCRIYFYPEELKTQYRSSVIAAPPEEKWSSIQVIREKHDRSFHRWMPHINMIYGFLGEEEFPWAVDELEKALASFGPFEVILDEVRSFEHKRSGTGWLRPRTMPPGMLHEIQAHLEDHFPNCSEQSRKSKWRYSPHLSIGQYNYKSEEGRDQLARWQKEWKPLSFTLDRLEVISRREDQPFAVRHQLRLAGEKIELEPALEELLRRLGYGEIGLSEDQRKVYDVVRKSHESCLAGKGIEPPYSLTYLLGSAYLGACRHEDDLDILCLGPTKMGRKEFFREIESILKGRDDLDYIRVILDASVPVIKAVVAGVPIDIQYASYPRGVSLCHPHYLGQDDIGRFDKGSLQSLLGYLDGRAILREVGHRSGLFLSSLRVVKGWARARQINANGFGYLGGYSWTLLTAWACSRHQVDTPQELLARLFADLATWDFRHPICLTPEGQAYRMRERDGMAIVTPLSPHKNSARNVTTLTADVLSREFVRSREILSEKGEVWSRWMAPVDPLEGEELLCLDLEGEHLQALTGWVEGRFPSLLRRLEKTVDPEGRPFSTFYPTTENRGVFLFALPQGGGSKSFHRGVEDFIGKLETWKGRPKGAKIDLVRRSCDEVAEIIGER